MKYLSTFLISFLFVSVAFAQTDMKENADGASQEGPVLVFDAEDPNNPVINYGQIEQGSEPYRTIAFTNTGNAPLIISNARGSCGCTVPTWPKEPIMPGEKSEIKIRYDTKRLGSINKTVRLTTNDAKGTHLIRIKGKISAKKQEESVPKKSSIFEKSGN